MRSLAQVPANMATNDEVAGIDLLCEMDMLAVHARTTTELERLDGVWEGNTGGSGNSQGCPGKRFLSKSTWCGGVVS